MSQAVAALLSPAVGVLISPFPIVGLILILLSKKARSNSVFYMLGWMLGNAVVFTVGMLGVGMGAGQNEPGTIAKIISLVLGGLLILLAVREFLKRPKKGEVPKTPKWFSEMTKIGVFGAAGFGLFLSALNVKNALLSLGAGASVGVLGLGVPQQGLSVVIFTLIASASIIVPTVAFLLAGHRLDHTLDSMRVWLVENNAVIMSVLLFVIGIGVISKAF